MSINKKKNLVLVDGFFIGLVYSLTTLHYPSITFIFVSLITFVLVELAILNLI
jgi:hypothetical protein